MLKKSLSLCLAVLIFAASLTACGKPSDNSSIASETNDTSTVSSDNYDTDSTEDGTDTTGTDNENDEPGNGSTAQTDSKGNTVTSKAGSSTTKPNVKIPSNMNLTGFPIVKKPTTLKIMVNTSASQPDFNKVKMFQAYEKMTNVKIDWINIPSGSTRQKVMMAFASNELPDAFLKCGNILTNNTIYTFAKDGMIYNLNTNDNLKHFAPNFYKFYSSKSSVKKALTFANNSVYSFPQGVEAIPNKVAGKLFINQKWLNKVGKKMPTTTQELYDVLVAFRDKDPNGNGRKDEIPLSAPNYNYITYMLYGAFGIGNRGVHHPYVDFDEKTGKPRLIGATSQYKQYLEYTNNLYKESLLDNNIFTMTDSAYVAKLAEGKVGAFCYTNLATIPDNIGEQFAGIDVALKGPNGDQIWYPVRSDLHSTGAFVITSACKQPEVAMRWVDYFYSDEGNLLYNYGVEGVSHVKNSDGTYKFVDSVYKAVNNGLTFDAAVSPHVAVGGSNPIITKDKYFYGREMDPIPKKAANNMVKYFPKTIWPTFIFTPAESNDLTIISTEIEMYVDKMAASFITGRDNISKEWDKYIARLKNMQMDRMLSIYNNAYKRMK